MRGCQSGPISYRASEFLGSPQRRPSTALLLLLLALSAVTARAALSHHGDPLRGRRRADDEQRATGHR